MLSRLSNIPIEMVMWSQHSEGIHTHGRSQTCIRSNTCIANFILRYYSYINVDISRYIVYIYKPEYQTIATVCMADRKLAYGILLT